LFSAATQSAAILNQQNPEIVQKMFLYGHNLGLAFQIIDDLIDFTSSSEELGKPALGDLKQGVFTAPLLFAIQKPEYKNQLTQLINSRFETEGDLQMAQKLISDSGAFKETLDFAQSFISKALTALDNFEDNIYKQDLKQIAEFILQRNF
jgi:geranylgeranyl pyrophosphate synthase